MAVAYKKEEILSASRIARSFGKVLTDLKAQQRRRVVVLIGLRSHDPARPRRIYE